MTSATLTLGQSIDRLISALEPLDESSRLTAIVAACGHLKIALPSPNNRAERPETSTLSVRPNQLTETPISKPPEKIDIRSLKNSKNPSSSIQMACVVAFYLQEHAGGDEGKASVNATDLERYFKQAGYKLPSRIAQTLIDAKAAGYMDSTGRGEYKLNAVGYNLVAHSLPLKQE